MIQYAYMKIICIKNKFVREKNGHVAEWMQIHRMLTDE